MSTTATEIYLNPAARAWRTAPVEGAPRRFHETFPDYASTPLTPAGELAATLGVGSVFVKDESQRLGLPAFKILGASYAIACALADRMGLDAVPSIAQLQERLGDGSDVSLVAATDGNHGRAVAHVAGLLGLPSTIYVPAEVAAEAQRAIEAEGATLVRMEVPYDSVVQYAAEQASDTTVVVQDTSWPGYEDIPQWIVDGYSTLLDEVDEALGEQRLDLVVVPAGVGSLAQAVTAHYRSTERTPTVLVVEPETAPAVIASLRAGRAMSVETADTVMTGLNCGTVSELAWPVLRDGVDAAVTISDGDALAAIEQLAGVGVDSGPCGAATLAGAQKLLAHPAAREQLGIPDDATVVLLSTESRVANPKRSTT